MVSTLNSNIERTKKLFRLFDPTIDTTVARDIKNTKKQFKEFNLKPIKAQIDLRNETVKATKKNKCKNRVKIIVAAAYSAEVFEKQCRKGNYIYIYAYK